MECLSVFGHGPTRGEGDEMDSAYLSTRVALSNSVRAASSFAAKHTASEVEKALVQGSAPALVRFIATVAARFDLVVTEKLVLQSLPVLGALGGAAINASFTDHFNTVARYHFGLRKLERQYDEESVRAEYRRALDPSSKSGKERVAAPKPRSAKRTIGRAKARS